MDVVKQQNAFATRLKAVHRQRDDFSRRDARVPVIRHSVGAEGDEQPGRKLVFDNVRAPVACRQCVTILPRMSSAPKF
jgi:hypothetical protein